MPAKKSFCGCSLVQGVHSLATYATFNGIFSFLALVISPHKNYLHTLMQIHNGFHALGVVFGTRGFLSLQQRDVTRLYIFAAYFPYAWIVNCVFQFVRMPYVCGEAVKVESHHNAAERLCFEVNMISWVVLVAQGFLYGYFTYIVWSLGRKFSLNSANDNLLPNNGAQPFAGQAMQANPYEYSQAPPQYFQPQLPAFMPQVYSPRVPSPYFQPQLYSPLPQDRMINPATPEGFAQVTPFNGQAYKL